MKFFYVLLLSLSLSFSSFAQSDLDGDFDIDDVLDEAENDLNDEIDFENEDFDESDDELLSEDEIDESSDEFVSEDDIDEDLDQLDPPKEGDPVYTPSNKAKLRKTGRGKYIYHPNQKKGLFKIDRDGNYYYKVNSSKRRASISVKGGVTSFKNLQDPDTLLTYEDIYGGTTAPNFTLEWEWKPFKKFRTLSVKVASGLTYDRGQGRLVDATNGNTDLIAQENYNFLYFPNSIGATYRFRNYYKQLFIPYLTGGIDYHVATEIRSDFKRTKFLGIPATHFGGGIDINLGWLERLADIELDREFGINNTYFTLEVRQIVPIDKANRDITNTMFVAGFHFEY